MESKNKKIVADSANGQLTSVSLLEIEDKPIFNAHFSFQITGSPLIGSPRSMGSSVRNLMQ